MPTEANRIGDFRNGNPVPPTDTSYNSNPIPPEDPKFNSNPVNWAPSPAEFGNAVNWTPDPAHFGTPVTLP